MLGFSALAQKTIRLLERAVSRQEGFGQITFNERIFIKTSMSIAQVIVSGTPNIEPRLISTLYLNLETVP